ncbi:MAG: hypothetical protein AB9842_04005 [Bacteroidales bacterium]
MELRIINSLKLPADGRNWQTDKKSKTATDTGAAPNDYCKYTIKMPKIITLNEEVQKTTAILFESGRMK